MHYLRVARFKKQVYKKVKRNKSIKIAQPDNLKEILK